MALRIKSKLCRSVWLQGKMEAKYPTRIKYSRSTSSANWRASLRSTWTWTSSLPRSRKGFTMVSLCLSHHIPARPLQLSHHLRCRIGKSSLKFMSQYLCLCLKFLLTFCLCNNSRRHNGWNFKSCRWNLRLYGNCSSRLHDACEQSRSHGFAWPNIWGHRLNCWFTLQLWGQGWQTSATAGRWCLRSNDKICGQDQCKAWLFQRF